jgi:hypothetical protein
VPTGFCTLPGAICRLPGPLSCSLALVPRQASAPFGRGDLSFEPRSRFAQLELHPPPFEEVGDCGALPEPLRVLALAPVPVRDPLGDRGLVRTHVYRVPGFRRANRSKLANELRRRGELAVAKSTKSKKTSSASPKRKRRASAASRPKAKVPAKRGKAKAEAEKKPKKPSTSQQPAQQAATAPLDATANAALAGQAALAGTRAAGRAVTLAAERAGVPLAAGGGLAAGVAGGLAVVRRRRRRRAGGFDVASAAERVGALGEEIGRVAIVIQKAADGSKRTK